MKLRESDVEPDSHDPFKDDLLGRRQVAEKFVSFLARVEGPFTLALTAPYGSGKTHFLRRCKVLLEQRAVPTVLINAWETDFASDPLAPILSELSEKLSDTLPNKDRAWKRAKSLAGKIAAASVPIGLKLATAGILDKGDFADASAVGDAVEKLAEGQFKQFAAAKRTVRSLQKELRALAEAIRRRDSTNAAHTASTVPPIVVIIDELDRCRPRYAIELLEVLKHFFDIQGIIFILAVDRAQLGSVARAVFGQGLDTDGYLRRLLDLEMALPSPNIRNFCANVMQRSPLFDWKQHGIVTGPIAALCEGAHFSLRKTQQFVTRAEIASTTSTGFAQIEDIALLVFLRDFDADLYARFRDGRITSWDLLVELRKLDPEFGRPTYGAGVCFVELLAGLGAADKPKSFATLLREDYELHGVQAGVLGNLVSGGGAGAYKRHFRQITACVDFCAAFG